MSLVENETIRREVISQTFSEKACKDKFPSIYVLSVLRYHRGHLGNVGEGECDLLHQVLVLHSQKYSDQGRQGGGGLPDNSVLREIPDCR